MELIDYTYWRDFFRTLLTDGESPVVNSSLFAGEGEHFDNANAPIYVEEIIGFDGEEFLTDFNQPGLQMTVTYNVYSDTRLANTAKTAEELRRAIANACFGNHAPQSGITLYGISARRRTATIQDGWRLSPLDVTFRLCKSTS